MPFRVRVIQVLCVDKVGNKVSDVDNLNRSTRRHRAGIGLLVAAGEQAYEGLLVSLLDRRRAKSITVSGNFNKLMKGGNCTSDDAMSLGSPTVDSILMRPGRSLGIKD